MLDVGMTEVLCFAIIAILVLGPDKLPEAARFAGRWYARIKRYISNIQSEIDRELNLSEFRKEMQNELDRIEALERKVQSQLNEIEKNKPLKPQQHIQSHQNNHSHVRVYFFMPDMHMRIPFKTWQPLLRTCQIAKNDVSPTTPIQLKIAV